tara:strand:+ start:457 stop:1167 length:711 start_codon:yes stop_codon:yes gene_type:complete
VSETNEILKLENVDSGYGLSQVLFDVSLNCPRKGATAILGRNGAGKSTLLKTVANEITPSKGKIYFDGSNTSGETTDKRVKRGMAYVPQEDAVFLKLSVQENLILGASSNSNFKKADLDMVLDFFPKLSQRLSQQAGTLSGGERKMLAMSRALIGKPKFIMLDEPTEGVWVGVIEEISDRLKELSKEISVVLVEQHVELALEVCDYAYVLDRGKIALEGTSNDIEKNPNLIKHLAP